jgi:O-antigen/teichoic acid export membrane protein
VSGQLSRLLKHSIVYGLAETVSRGIGFILLFIHISFLGKEEIAERRLFYVFAAMLSVLYTMGLDNAFLRYFMDDDLKHRKNDLFATAVTFTLCIGIALLAFTIPWADVVAGRVSDNPENAHIAVLLFFILILDTVVIYPTLALRAESRLGYYSFVAFGRFVGFIALNVWLVWIAGRGLKGVFEANLGAVAFVALLLLPVYREFLPGKVSPDILRKLLVFGVPTIFTILFVRIIDISDNFVIVYLLGEEGKNAVANYTPAYTLGMVGIMVFVNSFRLAWQPFFLSEKGSEDAPKLFAKVATYYAILISIAFLGLALFRREIFVAYTYFTPEEYPSHLAGIIPLVALGYVLYGFYIIMLAGIYIREKTWFMPVATLGAAALNLGLNFMLVPHYGIVGAAHATIAAYLFLAVIMYGLSRTVYNVPYEFGRIGVAGLVTIVPVILSFAVRPDGVLARFTWHVMLFAIPVIFYASGVLFDADEKARFRGIFTRFGR